MTSRGTKRIAALWLMALASIAWADDDPGHEIYAGRKAAAGSARVGTGDFRIPLAQAVCGRCHGRDGRGRTEAGVRSPRIDGAVLFAPTAARPAYDRSTLRTVLATGRDPTGRQLHPAMPRFDYSAEDFDALSSYLVRLTDEATRGFERDTVRLAVPVPAGREEAGRRVLAAIQGTYDGLRQPTPHGRALRFEMLTWRDPATMKRRLQEARPAALVFSLVYDVSDVLSLTRQHQLPFLLPMFALQEGIDALDARSHMPSREAQFRAIAAAAGPAAPIIADPTAQLWLDQTRLADGRTMVAIDQPPPRGAAVIVLSAPDGMPRVAFGPNGPRVYTPADSAAAWAVPAARAGSVVVTSDPRLAERNGAGEVRIGLRVGVELLVEALVRAGRDVTRAGFIEAFDGIVYDRPDWHRLDYTRFKTHGQTGSPTRQVPASTSK